MFCCGAIPVTNAKELCQNVTTMSTISEKKHSLANIFKYLNIVLGAGFSHSMSKKPTLAYAVICVSGIAASTFAFLED